MCCEKHYKYKIDKDSRNMFIINTDVMVQVRVLWTVGIQLQRSKPTVSVVCVDVIYNNGLIS